MADKKWYYNVETQQVEFGKRSMWGNRLGPYDTEAEARKALERAQERNDAWEQDDEDWEKTE